MKFLDQDADGSLEVLTSSGKRRPADIAILAIGVRPETALAKMAGIEIGQRGGIRVDEHMRTTNPDIFAVGAVDDEQAIAFSQEQPQDRSKCRPSPPAIQDASKSSRSPIQRSHMPWQFLPIRAAGSPSWVIRKGLKNP